MARECIFQLVTFPAVEQAAFVIAIGLFAGAVFVYICGTESAGAAGCQYTLSTAGFAVARVLLWSDSLPLALL